MPGTVQQGRPGEGGRGRGRRAVRALREAAAIAGRRRPAAAVLRGDVPVGSPPCPHPDAAPVLGAGRGGPLRRCRGRLLARCQGRGDCLDLRRSPRRGRRAGPRRAADRAAAGPLGAGRHRLGPGRIIHGGRPD